MRSYPTSWLQSLMSGVTSKPDPPPRVAKLTHVECVEAEYLQHVAWWEAHSEGRTLHDQETVKQALRVWREQRLAIARELDNEKAKA